MSMNKAVATWTAYAGVLECRRSCGGLGYSSYSLFDQFLRNIDIGCTWEGDNNVLLQQTGKYLLDLYKAKAKGKEVKQTMTCEWITTDDVSDQKCEAESIEQIMEPDFLLKAFSFRCNIRL